jgi:hypothetical protein
MRDTHHDGRIRLVSLTLTASGDPRPVQDVNAVLALVAQGQAKIYIKVPQGDVAFADRNWPIESRPDDMGVRILEANSGYSRYLNAKPRIIYGNDDSPDVPPDECETVHPEVTHLALASWHVDSLRIRGYAELNVFPSGLMLHTRSHLARQNWLVLCNAIASLRLCASERASRPIVTSPFGTRLAVHRQFSDSPNRVELKDILIDERIAATLGAPRASDTDDPYRLRVGSSGTYLLYRAAAYYYDLLVSGRKTLKDVQDWISAEEPALYRKTIATHAVRLLSPGFRRNSGASEGERTEVDPAIINSDDYQLICERSRFVTERLALLIFVAQWWIAECAAVEKGQRTMRPTHLQVDKKLTQAGFPPTGREALTRVVMWPNW